MQHQFTPVVEIINAADPAKPVYKSTPDKTYTALHGSKIVLEVGVVVAGDVLVRLYHQQSYLLTSKPVMVLRYMLSQSSLLQSTGCSR
jgi:hypothetical protein